jgi:predicted component of type VI protein secretion system
MKNINKKNFQKPLVGAHAPLFDRLIDENPAELEDAYSISVLDFEGLKESIIHEIEILLNTRPTAKNPA